MTASVRGVLEMRVFVGALAVGLTRLRTDLAPTASLEIGDRL
jgi:hypothetical protein